MYGVLKISTFVQKCHICKGKTAFFQDEKTGIVYHHCKKCEYIFKSPDYYQDFDRQKERYDLHTNDENDAGYIAYFQRFIDFILPYISECSIALDFGCGRTSLLATLLKKEGIRCDSYDPIYHPILDDDCIYDLIVSTEVFEHLHHPREVFSELISRLRTGGYLAIQTQFHSNEYTSFKQWYYHHDETHVVFFRAKSFEILAEMYDCRLIAHNTKNMVILQKQ